MKIAFIGSGNVGGALATRLANGGHDVCVGARDADSPQIRKLLESAPSLRSSTIAEAASGASIVFLAVPYSAVESALATAGPLDDKIVVDCTNPVGPGLTHGLQSSQSGSETVQALVPKAKVVKAFTIYGFENFHDSAYPDYAVAKPAMLLAGNDDAAKKTVGTLCAELGFEPVDTGDVRNALHLEHMTLLWIKMARLQKQGPNFVWARLRRAD